MNLSEQEINSGNEAIAKFNGDGYWQVWKKDFYKPHFADKFKTEQDCLDLIESYFTKHNLEKHKDYYEAKFISLQYHENFNLMMAVVENIEKGNYGFKMCRKVVEIYYDDSKQVILKTKEDCRKNSLWKALVEFVNLKK